MHRLETRQRPRMLLFGRSSSKLVCIAPFVNRMTLPVRRDRLPFR